MTGPVEKGVSKAGLAGGLADGAAELDPRIRIRAPLRCDGIGRLDCAEDLESGGRLAVRWLPLEANGDAAVRACEKLPTHPTLPRIRQTGQVGGSAFVAMDFPEGQLLSTMVGGGERLDVDLVIRVAAQLSDALATVHDQQVVHGEMSPDSVLLVPADRAYLWDMPLVIANRLTDRRGENRLMQNLVKTAPYLSPERARGDGSSREADVYSLGVVLCVAAGAPLPVSATTLGVVHQVANAQWTPRVPSLLPDPWRTTLARMVAVDPAQRPTAREVAQVFAELPLPAALPTVPEFPAVRLPPSLLAAADALMKRPLIEALPETVEVRSEPVVTPVTPVTTNPEMPRPSLTLEAPIVDVVRIPTIEIEAIGAEPAPAPVPPPLPVPPNVQLTESVSVSPELHQAGARAVTAPVEEERRGKRTLGAVGGALAGVIAALLFVAFSLAARPTPRPATVAPPASQPSLTKPAVVAAHAEDEDLAPLPHLPTRAKATLRPPVQAREPRHAEPSTSPALAPAAPTEPQAAAPVAPPAPAKESDFSFLEGAEAPHAELKRPTE
jgi:serine/threonine protein kinase